MKNGISLPRALTAVVLGVTIVLLFTLQLGWREWWQISFGVIVGIVVGMFVADHRRAATVLKNLAIWSKARAVEIPEIRESIKGSKKVGVDGIGAAFNGLWVFLLVQFMVEQVWVADGSLKIMNLISWAICSLVFPLVIGVWASEGIRWNNSEIGLFGAILYGPWRFLKCLAAVVASIGLVLFKIVVIVFFLPKIFFVEINEQRLMRVVAAIAIGGLAGTWQESWSWGLVGPVFYLLSPVIKRIFVFVYDLIDFEFGDAWESVWEFGKLSNM